MNTHDLPQSVDVIVLGAGLAGHCAALEAVRQGASVLLVEKDEHFGGSSSSGPGSFAFAGTSVQRAQGVEDSPELLREDFLKAGGGFADKDVVEGYVAHQHETYEWLVREGAEFKRAEPSSHQSVARSHPVNAATVVEKLHDAFVAHAGATYAAGCRARAIVRRQADGPVEAVRIERSGQEHEVRTTGAIVLATGGFLWNDELIRKFAPAMTNAVRMGGRANEGDGLIMGWALGAGVTDTGWLSSSFGASLNKYPDLSDKNGSNSLLLHPVYKGGIAVNRQAKRFTDESQNYQVLGATCLEQPDGIAFQIFDQLVMDSSVPNMMTRDFRKGLEAGLVYSAPTLHELAQKVGIDAVQLEKTVETYNASVASGHDTEFGRKWLVNNSGELTQLDQAPYYIYPCTAALLSSYGGLTVDAKARVIDVYGKPIARLYAAGEVTGGLWGASAMSGSSLGKSAIFGRLAGKEAAHWARVEQTSF